MALVVATSCGSIQSSSGDSDFDLEFQKSRLRELNAKIETKQKDSLIRRIESAPTLFPSDLTETTLIVETYDYKDFLNLRTNKFFRCKDSKKQRKYFARYDKRKKLLLKKYKHKVVYANNPDYVNLDRSEFRYVLKTTMKLHDNDEEVVFYRDGTAAGWLATRIYYIYDRTTGQVFGEIDEIETLAKL